LNLDDFIFTINDKTFEQKEINELINIGLDALPEKYREVIILKEFLDMSYQEIAELLNLTLPVVRIRIYRAKNKLREYLAPFLTETEKNKVGKIK